VPPHTTLEEIKEFGLTTGRLVFSGDFAEAWGQAKSNTRDVGQPCEAVTRHMSKIPGRSRRAFVTGSGGRI